MPTRDTMAGGRGGRAAAAQSSPKDGVIAAGEDREQTGVRMYGKVEGREREKKKKKPFCSM